MNNNKCYHTYLISKARHCLSILIVIMILAGAVYVSAASPFSLSSDTPGSFSNLAKNASPSVVNISSVKTISADKAPFQFKSPFDSDDPLKDFFDRFFRGEIPRNYKQTSLGSGFIIDKDGYILTNNHVVERSDEIKVTLMDGREFTATIIGRDPKTDLALIQIKSDRPLIPLSLGDSDKLEVGDWVVAIGNPFGLGNTVTAGIVSAKGRVIGAGPYDDFIQTDASINPGNSGGPLLNMNGEVVGINTAIFSQSGGNVGIGFAIPFNIAKDLLSQLKKGKVVRGWLGVVIQKITPALKDKLKLEVDTGVLIADVVKGGPADKAGMARGDVILSFDGKQIKDTHDLPYVVAQTPVGKTVMVELIRKGQGKKLQVIMGELAEERKAPVISEETPDLGFSVDEITPEIARHFGLSDTKGIVVTTVKEGTPAAEAGLMPGDVILEIDNVKVSDIDQFNRKIVTYKAGDTMLFLIKRQGITHFVTVNVEK